ncbi:MAG: hypothetical protein Q7S92_02265 [Candidatus Diapherotrites archaeon]|nr:hypothetical protein [Candidatus Diapherotrites archaeon]
MNRKFIVFLLCLISLSGLVSAQIDFSETSFEEKGYSDLVIDGKNLSDCLEVSFLSQNLDADFYPVFSLNTVFTPTRQGTGTIKVKLNNIELMNVQTSNELMNCSEDSACTLRVWADQNAIQEENTLEICLSTSDSITKAVLLESSKIGFYKTPIIQTVNFTQSTENGKYFVGEDIPIEITVTNTGSQDAVVDVNFARPVAEEYLHDLTVVGDTYYENAVIPAKGSKTFTYTAKLNSQHDLIGFVPAILLYTNVFEEQQELHSNYILLQIVEKIEVTSGLLVTQAVLNTSENTEIKAVIRNNSTQPLFDLKFELIQDNENLKLDRNAIVNINRMNVGEEKEIVFTASSTQTGNYQVGCQITENEKVLAACEPVSIGFRENTTALLLMQGAILGLVALAILIVLWTRK